MLISSLSLTISKFDSNIDDYYGGNMDKTVCVTTLKQGNPADEVEDTRMAVFRDTVKSLKGYPCLCLYTDTEKVVVDELRNEGITMIEQTSFGMGNIRREAILNAMTNFQNAEYYCWMEPEKPNLAKFIKPMVSKMKKEKSALGIFNRNGMTSYPSEQAHYYLFCRAVASKLLGFDFDYAFGPMILSSSAVNYFTEYKSKFDDKWDSILVPRIDVLAAGLPVSFLGIDFENDPRMTLIESGNPKMILKRIEQFNNVVPSLIERIHTIAKPPQ